MGLLDDAIREHLDLKRRRGADPTEVERAEREALGPVRRNRDPADAGEPEDRSDVPGTFAYDQAEEQDWVHDSLHESPAHAAGNGLADHDLGVPDFDAADAPPPGDWTASEGQAPSAEPFPTAPPPSPRRLSDMGAGETVEYNVEDALAAPHEGKGDPDDVLEETPEFLQDTPDHDRLWFEQRPPRDFDFDG